MSGRHRAGPGAEPGRPRPGAAVPSGAAGRHRAVREPVVTPSMRQLENTDCGAVCLAIVLAHLGRHVPLEELREQCGVSRDGVSAAAVLRAARAHGLTTSARRVRLAADPPRAAAQLAALPVPALLFVDGNHFVVLEGVTERGVRLNDPARGRLELAVPDVVRRFGGIVLVLRPGPLFRPAAARSSRADRLRTLLRPHAPALLLATAAGLAGAVPTVAGALALREFTERVLLGRQPELAVPLALLLLGVALLAGAVLAGQQLLLGRLHGRLSAAATPALVWRLFQLPGAYFGRRQLGGLVARAQTTDLVAHLLTLQLGQLSGGLLVLLGGVGLILVLDLQLGLVVLALVGLATAALRRTGRARRSEASALMAEQYERDGAAYAGLQAIEQLKAEGGEGDFLARLHGRQAGVLSAGQRLAERTHRLLAVPTLLAVGSGAVVLLLGGWRVTRGELDLGTLVAVQMLARAVFGPLPALVAVGAELQTLGSRLDMLDDVMLAEPDPAWGPEPELAGTAEHAAALGELAATVPATDPVFAGWTDTGPDLDRRPTGRLAVRGVTAGYASLGPPALHALDLDVAPGELVALVGPTGSGKSTVGRVVTGLLRPTAGAVLLDGEARERLPRPVLVAAVGYADQLTTLFEGTVADNVSRWDPAADPDRLHRALADAGLADVVARRGGLAAPVLEGGQNFSGGERQRLQLAAALATDPALVVLDEATSALDAELEQQVHDALRRRGCAALVITHRMATAGRCDRVVVLDGGRVVQQGHHDELVGCDGLYRELVRGAA